MTDISKKSTDMIRFIGVYPDEQIVHALCGQLSWTHFLLELGTDFSFEVSEAQ
jgi:predicted methyltransferase